MKVTCRYSGTCIIWLPDDTVYLQIESRVSVIIKQKSWFSLLFLPGSAVCIKLQEFPALSGSHLGRVSVTLFLGSSTFCFCAAVRLPRLPFPSTFCICGEVLFPVSFQLSVALRAEA